MESFFQHMEGSFYNDTPFHSQFLDQNFSLNDRPGAEFTEQQFQTLVRYREEDCLVSPQGTSRYHEFPPCSYDKLTADTLTPTHVLQNGNATSSGGELDELSEQGCTDDTWVSDDPPDNGSGSTRGPPLKKIRRLRANDRERRRMRSLNRALDSLKKCLPVPQSKRRVTKLEILRIACSYIRSLSDTLNEDSRSNDGGNHGRKSRGRGIVGDPVVNGFSVAQRLEILSGNNANRI